MLSDAARDRITIISRKIETGIRNVRDEAKNSI